MTVEKQNSKVDRLLAVYTQFVAELRTIGHPSLNVLADSLDKSLTQMNEMLTQSKPPVRPSALVTGLEQGLREAPEILESLPDEAGAPALKAYMQIVESHIPGFFERQPKLIEKVKERGKIRSENEWYLIRHRVDELEGLEGQGAELETLYKLLGEYETRA